MKCDLSSATPLFIDKNNDDITLHFLLKIKYIVLNFKKCFVECFAVFGWRENFCRVTLFHIVVQK